MTVTDSTTFQIKRLFHGFQRGTSSERAQAYVEALAELSIERLKLAVDYFLRSWERDSPPPIAKVRSYCLGRETDESDEVKRRREAMRAHLWSYSDCDYWLFRDESGVPPTRILADQLGVKVPHDVIWSVPDRAEAADERKRIMGEARVALNHTLKRGWIENAGERAEFLKDLDL